MFPNRKFRYYFTGQVLSTFGDSLVPLTIAFAALQVGGPAALGLVLAANRVPIAVLVLFGGALGDRWDRRRVMIGADVLQCGAQAAAGVLLVCGVADVAHLVVLQALAGVGTALPPPPPAFGGQQPSTIICPGEFLLVAAEAASSAPADPTGLSDRQRGTTRDALARAVAAVEEVLKFIPEGADAVPETAVTSSAGTALYSQDPGRFSRARLEAVLAAYRESSTAYATA